jgi:hypothetical protein
VAKGKWESKTLGLSGPIKAIAEQAEAGIETIATIMTLIRTGGEIAKQMLSVVPSAAAVVKKVADEIITACEDFKEVGAFYLVVDPFNEEYGGRPQPSYGLEIAKNGDLHLFKPSISPPPMAGKSYVNDEYAKSLDLNDLNSTWRDNKGRAKGDEGFQPPVPIIDMTGGKPSWVRGGYNPATWTGTAEGVVTLENGFIPPQMTPSEVLSLMSDAFDDEGDIAAHEVISAYKTKTFKAGPFMDNGTAVTNFDPMKLQKVELYELKDTKLSLSERRKITSKVRSGRPSFQGGVTNGVEVSVLVGLFGVADFTKLMDIVNTIKAFFPKLPELEDLEKAFNAITDPPTMQVSITNNTEYGALQVDDYIRGNKSGSVGQITKIVGTPKKSVRNRKSYKIIYEDPPENTTVKQIVKEDIDGNKDGLWQDIVIEYSARGDVHDRTFYPGENVYEAEEIKVLGQKNSYPIKGSGLFNAEDIGEGAFDDSKLPKYGHVTGIDTTVPDSVLPDFKSIKIKDHIPGYADFFDDIIELAESLKGFADDVTAFIQALLDTLDDYLDYFETIAANITAFLELFTKGIPSSGIYWLPITTTGGNSAIQSALTGSEGQPPDVLKFSGGIMLVSVTGAGGGSITPLFEALGLEFQSV